MDHSPPGSSVHGILQAWILEWVAIPFSRASSQPRDRSPRFTVRQTKAQRGSGHTSYWAAGWRPFGSEPLLLITLLLPCAGVAHTLLSLSLTSLIFCLVHISSWFLLQIFSEHVWMCALCCSIFRAMSFVIPTSLESKLSFFPKVMYGCESWTVKKAEKHQRNEAFKLWCWRLLRIPWTTWRSNQSILKEMNSEYSLEGMMLKLKLQYSGHLMWRADSLEKTFMLGKIEGRRRGWQRMRSVGCHHPLNEHEFEQTPGDGEGQGNLVFCRPWGGKEADTTEQQQQPGTPPQPLDTPEGLGNINCLDKPKGSS